jgi:hypothetical protein
VFEQTLRDIWQTVKTVVSLARNIVDGISSDTRLSMVRMMLLLDSELTVEILLGFDQRGWL